MSFTKIEDMAHLPQNFTKYVIEGAIRNNAFLNSGVLVKNEKLKELINKGGVLFTFPFFKQLDGDAEIITDSSTVSSAKINSAKDVARLLGFRKAFSASDLSAALSASDPLGAIQELLSEYWNKQYTKVILAMLVGVMEADSMAKHVHDITGGTGSTSLISPKTAIKAKSLLGDKGTKIASIAMHSATYYYLLEQDQIQTIIPSDGKGEIYIYKPLNARVVVDDDLEYDESTKIATTYLFGAGTISYAESDLVSSSAIVRDEKTGAGVTEIITRACPCFHVNGIQWIEGNISKEFPTIDELKDKTHYTKVQEDKNIPIIQFKHKIV